MHIGLFTDTYTPQINGVATSTTLLKAQLEALGHKVFVFTTTDPKARSKTPDIFRLPSMPFVFLPTHRMTVMYSPKLLLHLRKLNLDIIHTQTEFPLGIFGKVVSDFLKIPHVHTYHTMYEDYVHYVANGHVITPAMAQKYSRLFCNRADMVIAPVDKAKQSLMAYGVRKPIAVIPTGLDFSAFNSRRHTQQDVDALKTQYGITPQDRVVVYVGRVAKEKSLEVVIQAFKPLAEGLLPAAKLVIVGDGPLKQEYEALAQSLGIKERVVFTGAKPWADIGKYYRLGHVFATASTSETQGLTYLEAMAAGLPVVAKKDPSVEGIIHHGETGYLFETDEQLPALLAHVLTHQKEAAAVAKTGHESIQSLSAQQFAQNVAALYQQVIADKKANARKFRIGFKGFKAGGEASHGDDEKG